MKILKLIIISTCILLCASLIACGDFDSNSNASDTLNENLERTSFSKEEENRFVSTFGFVIPFIKNRIYRVEEYNGWNQDLMAYENGLAFIADGLTQEECKEYIDNLKKDENYSFEYPQDGYYYFSRDGFFVKVEYVWKKAEWGLAVYTYSYTFENVVDSDVTTDKDESDTDTDIPDIPRFGFKYEKHNDSYSIIDFYGDEDGIVEIPDFYEGLPVRYIRGNAFFGANEITELIIGDNIYSIEGNAFMLCSNLEKVTFGNGLELIDMQAFFGCEKLEEITIPASVTFIGAGAFRNCFELKSVILENPENWCISSDIFNRPFPKEEMSNSETVAVYFTQTYASVSWLK